MSEPVPTRRVDAHLHLWDLSTGGYRWLTPDLGPLHASFSAADAEQELRQAGMTGAVLVQADDSERDTDDMLAAADRHAWVLGVVGWVDLEHPTRAAEQLDRRLEHPRFRGVRQLVHTDPRADLLGHPDVRASLRLVAERGCTFDVPDAWPRHLPQVRDLAADLPDLRVVVDHLGKPPADPAGLPRWREQLAAVAALPNTVAKVSGLQHLDTPRAPGALRDVWDVALELFGPGRLMYGGDWPMTVPSGGYARSWARLGALVAGLSPAEQAQLLSGTATEVYGLPRASPIGNGSVRTIDAQDMRS